MVHASPAAGSPPSRYPRCALADLPSIVLYGPAQAPYTEKVRRGLLLKKLPFELREPESPEDYRRWSPETGLLPVIRIGDERVHDSTDILLRIDELFPEPPLLSRDPVVAQQQRQLEDWADESFLWYFMRWIALARERAPAGEPSRLRRFLAWLRAGGTWERPETALLRGIHDRLGDLSNFLGTRPFFYADAPSMADLAVYGMLHTIQRDSIPGGSQLLAQRPSLIELMRRVEGQTDLG